LVGQHIFSGNYGVVALCCVSLLGAVWYRGNYYQGKYDKLVIAQAAEKVKIYEAFT
jgi:hypothetical protein